MGAEVPAAAAAALPPGPRARAAVLCIVARLAILYPLTGLSRVAALLFDRGVGLIRARLIPS